MFICNSDDCLGCSQISHEYLTCVYNLLIQISCMKLAIDDEILKTFTDFKFRKIEARYLTFKINKTPDGKEHIIIDKVGKREETWHDFLGQLPPSEFRYCVFDLSFTNSDNMKLDKIFFCNWNPDTAPLKIRVAYATAKQNFRTYLDLNGKEITLNSAEDLTEAGLIKEFSK